MADWTTIADTQVDPDAPVTSELGYAWRDNPIAIAEGASGAPRIRDAALSVTVTAAGTNWVRSRMAGSGSGQVGTYAMARRSSTGTSINFGDVVSGSGLFASGVGGLAGSTLSGSWMCCGASDGSSAQQGVTLFLRIS